MVCVMARAVGPRHFLLLDSPLDANILQFLQFLAGF
jgi:hypothetical protein